MNDRNASASPEHRGDREEIARLLPTPAEWGLPREQHLRHKDTLMRHIDRDLTAVRIRRERRLLRPALLAPATALTLACALTAGIALTDGDRDGDGRMPRAAATDIQPAAALLDRISDATSRQSTVSVRDDQFVYTREKIREADLTSGRAVVGPLRGHETWVAQDPKPLHKLGLVRADGETLPINAEFGDTEGTPAGFSRPTYGWLASLPGDPDNLLAHLYANTPRAEGRERHQAVFEQIGSLLGGFTPPRTAAALYRAAAKIPGVTEAPRARDAIGRQGLGIARVDTRYGIRTEWVFDSDDFTFLGSRSVLTADTSYGRAGTLLSSSAELEHAVVDTAGQRPGAADRTSTGGES
ncbi:CU044_5270 family protein [Streptomyces sp. NPDC005017]|uniref:CU044_5270 family protein n=1 Tax=Streptomyces sp. NPDC005017 TaxID=3364706 RepID=UPI003696C264